MQEMASSQGVILFHSTRKLCSMTWTLYICDVICENLLYGEIFIVLFISYKFVKGFLAITF